MEASIHKWRSSLRLHLFTASNLTRISEDSLALLWMGSSIHKWMLNAVVKTAMGDVSAWSKLDDVIDRLVKLAVVIRMD